VRLLAPYRRLGRNGPLVRLLGGEFVSAIGDWLYIVALLVIVYQETDSAVVLGLVGAARQVPYILLSVPAGIVADRYDRRLVLLSTDIVRGSIMAVLAVITALGGPLWLIVVLAICATCFAVFFGPAMGSLLPTMVRDESEFGPANSAFATLDNLAFVVGPAIGGVLIVFGGITLAFVLNALSFAVIAVVLWRLPRVPAPARAAAGGGAATPVAIVTDEHAAAPVPPPAVLVDAAVVVAAIDMPAVDATGVGRPGTVDGGKPAAELRDVFAPLATLLVFSCVTYFFTGGLEILTILIAVNMLGVGEGAMGFLNAAIGVGGVVGALVSGALVVRRRLGGPLLLGAIAMGLGLIATGLAPTLWFALVALAVMETGDMILEVAEVTLLQRATPDVFRGRALGAMDTVRMLALVAGALVLPALADDIHVSAVLIVSGLLTIVACAALVTLFGLGRVGAPPSVVPAAARVPSLPIFSGLPAPRMEAALEKMQEERVLAGQVIIREGAPADRFYVVSSGRFSVTQATVPGAPERFVRECGPDDYFGEIGLLRGIPRTATVTAVTDGVLASLGAAEFLELVASGPGVQSRFLERYGAGGFMIGQPQRDD
jgi:MFS family permease